MVYGDEGGGTENLHLDALCLSLNWEHGSVHFHRSIMVLNNQFRNYFTAF